MPDRFAALVLAACVLAAAGCANRLAADALAGVDAVLLGEQHDDAGQHRQQRELIEALAARGRLAAVALEMAEQGTSTAGLPRGADAPMVRAALQWNEDGWPWQAYGPAIMAAVAAGVPVLGADLPRERIRAAMADPALDGLLDAPALAAQREAIRLGHCDLLPASQLAPMVRVQVARDRAMARTLVAAALPGKTVVLLAGGGHVDPALGVPRHLPPGLRVRPLLLARTAPAGDADPCDALRRRLPARPAG